jgi:histidinol-phosphate aminotransferase
MPIVKKSLQNVKAYVPGKPIEELQRELRLDKVYKLASNEIPFPPLYIRRALMRDFTNINRYPEAQCFYLRRMLSKKYNVTEDQLVIGNGSDEIIVLALRACVEKGNEVIVGFPTFLIYEIQGAIEEARIKRVPLKNYRYDLDAMASAVTKNTKIIFIANPDNPHGTYLTHKEVGGFLKRIPDDVLVFFDEAYFEFVSKRDFPRSLALLKKKGNIMVTRTFSKVYGLAGFRIGYGITTPEIARALNTVREPFNVNRSAQVSACAALTQKEFVRKVKTCVSEGKRYLYREFDKMNLEYIRSVTNFILVNFKKDTKELNQYLLKNGVIVRMLDPWGLKNYFRVTVGLPRENRAFIKALRSFLKRR